MSAIPTYFKDFLSSIRLSDNQRQELITGHTTLRERLENDEELSPIIVNTFLQGSYKRATAVKPKNGNRADVDIIVVTNLDSEQYTPQEALDLFLPFLEKHYAGKYRMQGRSIGIEMSYVDLDIVPTSAPSEVNKEALCALSASSKYSIEESLNYQVSERYFERAILEQSYRILSQSQNDPDWKLEPLLIPDREAAIWEKTHPYEQIRWTFEKNKNCNGHYVNVVKAIKWWKKVNLPDLKHPKSYPLEHFVGYCCPDNLSSVAEGVVNVLETIVTNHPTKPFLADHGVPEHDVFKRITEEDYKTFYDAVCDAAKKARDAYDESNLVESAKKWKGLLGSEFPDPPSTGTSQSSEGFTARTEKTQSIPSGRYA